MMEEAFQEAIWVEVQEEMEKNKTKGFPPMES